MRVSVRLGSRTHGNKRQGFDRSWAHAHTGKRSRRRLRALHKLEAMTATDVYVDWSEVVRCGSKILAEKSKDLLASAYLCAGLFELEKYARK